MAMLPSRDPLLSTLGNLDIAPKGRKEKEGGRGFCNVGKHALCVCVVLPQPPKCIFAALQIKEERGRFSLAKRRKLETKESALCLSSSSLSPKFRRVSEPRLPLHIVAHLFFCSAGPWQYLPPHLGLGLLQNLSLLCDPCPQRGELQSDHVVHSDQPPVTGIEIKRRMYSVFSL